ncbi:hypothetical protein [Erythrobacter sp.]|uniref:hypothetical protein n=1 Tax=Erythrobacter sp. TaxID=1042 RepID=UPI002EAFC72B|nr:hypothetical protein [Erythrobacter sp.]
MADTSPVPAAGELPGEYRVAGIDGAEVSGGIGIALTITDQLIRFDPTCAGFSWTYTYEAGALRTDRPEKPREPGAPYTASIKRPTCRIAVHPEQRRLAAALDAVSEVARTEDNALVLSGGGHSVTLFTQ